MSQILKRQNTKSKSTQQTPDGIELQDLWNRLESKGMFQRDAVSLSFLLPGMGSFLLMAKAEGKKTKPYIGIHSVQIPNTRSNVGSTFESLPSLIRFHAELYSIRPDVGAIVRFNPPWSSKLAYLDHPLPLVFDEQCRQLGAPVHQLPVGPNGNLIASEILLSGANGFLLGHEVIITSVTREKAIYNCELIEKCAKAYLLAIATGGTVRNIPWFVRLIAKQRLLKDEKKAARFYKRGERPSGFKAY
ncbi:aldose epimerase [Leptospira yanagawae]|uniref:Aldose epimerase n=1 Tax=Leptospira yanagawae TaxID=293069 RepID=A0ABY2LYZ5_9LEPT|nr:class II aldolase/adducin family protein [Leptospira yanagawae]TGL18945.1 aldose epimerase [Leptospira yanagawae]